MTKEIKVLYVEDDKEWQKIIREIISMLGYQLDIASSSKEAIFKLTRSTYHIALLDKRLNEDDPENDEGLNIATIIAGMGEGTKIIVFTAYGNIEDAREAFRKIKVKDFIGKDQPIKVIKKALEDAADDALLEFKRPMRGAEEILVTKGNALNRFLSKFPEKQRPESYGLESNERKFELFARRMLGNLRPLLPDKNEARLISIGEIEVLQVQYWSKTLGAPITSLFGKLNEMKTLLQHIENNVDLRYSMSIKSKVEELFDENFPDFGGAVFVLKDIEFEEFESSLDFKP